MAKLNVSPTKSNYLGLSKQLRTAKEGYELLEEKRQILVLELMSRLGEAKRIEKIVQEKSAVAYQVLHRAVLTLGSEGLTRLASGMTTAHSMEVVPRRFMGLDLPTVEASHPKEEIPFNYVSGAMIIDEVIHRFRELTSAVDKLAETENALLRLAREVKKTQRRVNALEKIFIPDYNETINYILGSLEEKERDEFVIMKLIKSRLQEQPAPSSPDSSRPELENHP
jgi:V/A-type H+-transporting ATPase subunit D